MGGEKKKEEPKNNVKNNIDKRVDSDVVFEFGGAKGALMLMTFSPALMFYFWICLHHYDGALARPESFSDIGPFFSRIAGYLVEGIQPLDYGLKVYLGFCLFQAVLAAFLPGPVVKGLPIPSEGNKQLSYVCNGVACWYVTLITAAGLHLSGLFPLTEIVDNFGPIMTAAVITGNVVTWLTYLITVFGGFKTHRMSGNLVYDVFMGASLNPRIGPIDLKMWAEIRIPWILLFFISVSAALKQYQQYGYIASSMWFMVLAHFLYANACMKGEECIPTTWDIFYEKWGYMLIFWNFAGVPFTYCYSSMYLSTHPPVQHSLPYTIFCFALLLVGYYIWDTANSQKNRFRMQLSKTYIPRNTFPQLPWGTLKNPTYIKTQHGNLLLTGGWWGIARKIHYTADLMMASSWGLITGFGSFLPYFYVTFFIAVLTHRVSRDMERCAKKYGKDWERYCKEVPYIFIPGIY